MLHVLILNYRHQVRGPMLDVWAELPKRPAELAQDLKKIRVTDSRDYAISDSRSDIEGLTACISPCDSLAELNELAEHLQRGTIPAADLEAYIKAQRPTVQDLLMFIDNEKHSFY